MNLNYIDIATIAAYFFITLIFGLIHVRKNKNIKDYAVGSKNFNTPLLVATIFATMTGSNTILGTSERIFSVGIIFVLVRLGDPIYKYILSKYIVPRMGRFSEAISVGDILETKFGKLGKITGGVCAFIKSVGSVSAQIAAISYFLSFFTNIPFVFSAVFSSLFIVFYSSIGGIRSVVMTDAIQFIILVIGIPLLGVLSVYNAGGVSEVADNVINTIPTISTHEFIWYFSLFFLSSIPVFNPAVVQRMLMTRNLNFLSKSFQVSALMELPMILLILLMVGSAMILDPSMNGNNLVPNLIQTVIPNGLKGLIIIGMLAVIMSTADSFLNVSSVSLVNDILKPIMKNKLSDKRELFILRLTTAVVGIFSTVSVLYFSNIFEIYFAFLNFWVPVMVVPIYAAIFNSDVNKRDFVIAGAAGTISWFFCKHYISDIIHVHHLLLCLITNALFLYRKKIIHLLYNIRLKKIRLIKRKKTNKYPDMVAFKYSYGITIFFLHVILFFVLPSVFINKYITIHIIAICLVLIVIFQDFLKIKSTIYYIWNASLLLSLVVFPLIVIENTHCYLAFLYASFSFAVLFSISSFKRGIIIFISGCLFIYFYLSPTDNDFYQKIFMIFLTTGLFVGGFIKKIYNDTEYEKLVANSIASQIAHELRTPLQFIKLRSLFMHEKMVNFINNSEVPSTNINYEKLMNSPKEFIETVDNSLKKIDNILTKGQLSKINTFRKLDLGDLVKKIVSNYPYEANNQKTKIDFDLESINGLYIYGDESILSSVLENILSNSLDSLKGSKTQEIRISSTVIDDQIHLSIKDSGYGIPPNRILKIFKPYISHKKTGTGIGLYFCKNAMDLHKGEIFCNSELGIGTEFTITFNIER